MQSSELVCTPSCPRGKANTSSGITHFVDECLRRVPPEPEIRARFDSGFYSKDLFATLEDRGVVYLCEAMLYHA